MYKIHLSKLKCIDCNSEVKFRIDENNLWALRCSKEECNQTKFIREDKVNTSFNLLPCPFCGQPPEIEVDPFIRLYCQSSDDSSFPHLASTKYHDNKESAIASWNTRIQ